MRPGNQESGTMKNLETIHLNISLPASRVPQNKDCEWGVLIQMLKGGGGLYRMLSIGMLN